MTLNLATLSFQEAIAYTQDWLEQIATNEIETAQILSDLKTLLSHRNGVRGFFVAYLTGENVLADKPPTVFIEAFQATAENIKEILVKNVAMSTAMAIAHGRNNDAKNQAASERVTRRSQNILRLLAATDAKTTFQQEKEALLSAVKTQTGEYETFLKRWKYDDEQRAAIKISLEAIAL